ncbi:MAG: DUF502 domain-containing protein [Planctomycetota bacterium]
MQAIKNFRLYFFRGMAALLPTILTIWIFVQCYFFIQDKVSVHINRGLAHVLVTALDWYPSVSEEQVRAYIVEEKGDSAPIDQLLTDEDILRGVRIEAAENFWVNGKGRITGFFVAIIGVCFIGAFLASVAGRTIWHFMEKNLMRVPLVRQVYPYIKQVTDFFLAKKKLDFSKVVAFEYPRKGTWSIGLVTGTGLKKVALTRATDFITVFVPTSPTPFTGYVIMVPRTETIELEMSIEEALRFVISGGVITPAEHLAFEASRQEQKKETQL